MATAEKRAKAHKLLKNNEPRIGFMTYDHDMMKALQYYNLNHDGKEKRKWVLERFPKLKFNTDLSDYYYRVAGTLIRIENNGNELSDEHKKKLEDEIAFLTKPSTKVVEVKEEKPKASVQDAMEEKVSTFLGEFAGLVDEYVLTRSHPKVDNLVNTMGIRGPMAKKVIDKVQKNMSELQEAIAGTDKQLVEGYSNFKKTELKKLLGIYEQLVASLQQAKVTTVRKPRAKKVKPPAVIAKSVKYSKENVDLAMKSINPAHVVGQSEVWFFNTKYRRIACYKAREGAALSWKGTTLTDWDTEKSYVKTVRKPEEIKKLMDLGTRAWNKYGKELKSKESTPNGRCNEETIILVTFR